MKLPTLSLVSVAVLSVSSLASAATYSTGFENPGFTLGPISPGGPAQGGWSGGAQPDFTNNDAGDEQIVNTTSHFGAQSWHYARGYNSPGQGTPFTPGLVDKVSVVGSSITGSVSFKAHTGGDGSLMAINTGSVAGDDRAEILAYVDNLPGGITVRSFTGAAFTNVPIATGLSSNVWHDLSFTLTRTASSHQVSISLNGGAPVVFSGGLGDWRDANAFAYSEANRLKFNTRHADGDLNFNGFFLDDISYSVAVPEPTTLAALAGAGVLGLRRRRA